MNVLIDKKNIGLNHPTYFIADIAANHDGDLSRAIDLIYLAANAGADAAKFQHFSAKTIVSDYGFKALGGQFSHQSKWKKSVYEVYDSASLDIHWTPVLKETCDKAGITFLTSPYSYELVDAVDQYVPAYKIGSGDITWLELIRYMASKHKPLLIATGASTFNEICYAVDAALEQASGLVLMQCNTNYTGSVENFKFVNLNVLKTYKAMYPDLALGLSDHTPGHAVVLGAVALGARVIEKHFTNDTNREGPDHGFSLNAMAWRDMVDRTRELESALGCGIKRIEANEKDTVILQRRAIRMKNSLKAGTILTNNHVVFLRPCPSDAIPPYMANDILGKTLIRDMNSGEHLRWNRSKLAVIIPAWNERDTIGNVVRSVIGISTPIVVNDCSKDSTATEAAEAGAIVVNHEVNHGYDGALNSGFQKAAELGFEYAITFDADGQHDADLLRQFYMLLLNGNDLVLGIRPFFPRFSEFIFSLVSRFTLGVRDPLCGMKGYRMDLFHRHGCFDSCKSIGTRVGPMELS